MLLVQLPEELLAAIFDLLPEGLTHESVALVCKKFHRIVEPLFFKSIRVNLYTSPNPSRDPWDGNARLKRLVRLFQSRNQLGAAVKRLHFGFPESMPSDAVSDFNWRLRARILPKTPTLRILSIRGPISFGGECVYQDWGSHNPGDFGLEDFLVQEEPGEDKIYLPSLRTLIWEANRPRSRQSFSNSPAQSILLPPSVSNLTDIRLYSQSLADSENTSTPPFIAAVLLAIRTLRCFHLELHGGPFVVQAPLSQGFVQALFKHENTLEELFIGSSDLTQIYNPTHTPYVRLDLSSFTAVKRLGIPEPLVSRGNDRALVAGSGLPPNIETLQLQYPMDSVRTPDVSQRVRVASIERLLIKAPEPFPKAFQNLSLVIFWLQEAFSCAGWTYGYGAALDSLEDRFQHPRFEWLSTPFARETPFFPRDSWSRPATI